MNLSIRKKLNVLIQLAESDKDFAEAEWNVISNTAKINHLPIEEVFEIMRKPEPIGEIEKLDDETRFEYLYTCVELIMADNKLFECELAFCKNIATKLNLKDEAVNFLVENFTKKPFTQLRTDVLQEYRVGVIAEKR